MPDRITQIKIGASPATDIGVRAANVFIYDDSNQVVCTLQDFFNEWNSFKQNAHFIRNSAGINSNTNVQLWFDSSSNNE